VPAVIPSEPSARAVVQWWQVARRKNLQTGVISRNGYVRR